MKPRLIVTLLLVPGLVYVIHAQTPSQVSPPAAAPASQAGPQSPAAVPAAPGRFFPPAYPVRPAADPAIVQRGKQVFSVNCGFCHGSDARGGKQAPISCALSS